MAGGGDELLAWRKEFPILEAKTYLINNSLGAMPRAVYDNVRAFADKWATEGVVAWHDWLPMVTETADLVGKLVGAPRGSMLMHQNVSTLMAIVASALSYEPGKRDGVVYTDQAFSTVHYVWERQSVRGARVTVVKSRDGMTIEPEELEAAIDERTKIVVLDHVFFRSSALNDAKRIARKAHAVGALLLLDVYQSIGTVPFDVVDLDVDFMVGGSVKWLCGGPGAAYLYVKPSLVGKLEPWMVGWFSHKKPFDFTMDPIDYADDVHRFMGGSPGVPALYSARAGYEILAKVGVPAIRKKSQALTTRIREKALAYGLAVNTPADPEKRGGTICVDWPGAQDAEQKLIDRGFVIDWRPKCGIRISPHFYNTADECDAILDEIVKLRG